MSTISVKTSRTIQASPASVYAVFADYRVGHPAVLPKPYFTKLSVIEGGQGAGTRVEVHMDVYGNMRIFHMLVSEPEPGHILMETDPEAGVQTTFTVDSVDGDKASIVTLATESRPGPGLQGFIERITYQPIMSRIYKQELDLLEQYLQRPG